MRYQTKPVANIPQRKKAGILGTPTDEIAELDKKYMEEEGDFEERAKNMQRKREVTGESSIYSRMQPFDRPEAESLLEKRIDYLWAFGKKGEPDYKLCWCQGEVIVVGKNAKKPNTVKVRWDPMQNSDKYKDSTESTVDLLPTFWNKDKYCAWRMDIDVDILMASDNESDKESADESETELWSESENELDDEVNSCASD